MSGSVLLPAPHTSSIASKAWSESVHLSQPSGKDGEPNLLIHGENLAVLRTLTPFLEGRVTLIYIDPPFATGRVFTGQNGAGFDDTRTGHVYLEFLRQRLIILHQLLAPDGSLYVHLSPQTAPYVQIILDKIFGPYTRHRQIIWKRTGSHPNAKGYACVHDVILFYPKSRNFYFSHPFRPYSEACRTDQFRYRDPDGRRFATADVTGESLKTVTDPAYRYTWNGHHRIWRCRKETMARWDRENRLYYTRNGLPRKKRYLDEAKGIPVTDLWDDIPALHAQSKERTGYPTQKPRELLERIIHASSREGDLVLDAFCGSGTTLAVADQLNRRWIGIDLSFSAIRASTKRLPGYYDFSSETVSEGP